MPVKKNSSTVVVSDKYNLKPIPLKRQSATAAPGDAAPPAEKKYKPLNTTPNATKEIKVKIIPPQRESSWRALGTRKALLGGKGGDSPVSHFLALPLMFWHPIFFVGISPSTLDKWQEAMPLSNDNFVSYLLPGWTLWCAACLMN